MSAARIITTTEKFDKMGKLVERITTEEFLKEKICECMRRKISEKDEEKKKEKKVFEEILREKRPIYTDKSGYAIVFPW